MTNYVKNEIVTGTVTGIETYGIFVSLNNNYSGLVHISEISDGFVKNINNYVELNEVIKVKILEVDQKNNQVKLSIKNFDYRINKKNQNKINETSLGFSTLQKKLDNWIEYKKEELKDLAYNYKN